MHRPRRLIVLVPAAALAVAGAVLAIAFAQPLVLLLGLGLGLPYALVVGLTQPRSVSLHEEGLVLRRWLGAPRALAFDDCRALYRELETRQTLLGTILIDGRVLLEGQDGRRLRVPSHLTDAEALFRAIERRCVRPVREAALEAFDDGESMTFGPIVLSRDAITVRGRAHPWAQVERIDVSPERFALRTRGARRAVTVPFRDVPYPFVAVELARRAGAALRYVDGFVESTPR